jgi:DNA polymerase
MTAEEKTSVACFIDMASCFIRGGYSGGERQEPETQEPEAREPEAREPVPPSPLVMVIGESLDSGEYAVLLEKMLGSIGLSKDNDCFITNVTASMESQIQFLKPRFILCLGELPSQTLLHSTEPIGKLRGKITDFKIESAAIPLVATYHPNDFTRNEELKRPCWDDLKLLRGALNSISSGAK